MCIYVVSPNSVKAKRRTGGQKPGTEDMIQPSVELSAEQVSGISSTSASAHTTQQHTTSIWPGQCVEVDAIGVQSMLTPAASKRRRLRKRNKRPPPTEAEREAEPVSQKIGFSSGVSPGSGV